jgi:hypothetical protein
MQKWFDTSLAERARLIKRWSCHSGSPEWAEGRSARRERKKEVFLTS